MGLCPKVSPRAVERAAYISEMLHDVINDDLLGLIRVYPSKWVHVDDSIFKANEWNAQCALESL